MPLAPQRQPPRDHAGMRATSVRRGGEGAQRALTRYSGALVLEGDRRRHTGAISRRHAARLRLEGARGRLAPPSAMRGKALASSRRRTVATRRGSMSPSRRNTAGRHAAIKRGWSATSSAGSKHYEGGGEYKGASRRCRQWRRLLLGRARFVKPVAVLVSYRVRDRALQAVDGGYFAIAWCGRDAPLLPQGLGGHMAALLAIRRAREVRTSRAPTCNRHNRRLNLRRPASCPPCGRLRRICGHLWGCSTALTTGTCIPTIGT